MKAVVKKKKSTGSNEGLTQAKNIKLVIPGLTNAKKGDKMKKLVARMKRKSKEK